MSKQRQTDSIQAQPLEITPVDGIRGEVFAEEQNSVALEMSSSRSGQFLIVLLGFLSLGTRGCREPLQAENTDPDLLQSATNSYFQFDLGTTRELLEQVLGSKEYDADDRAEAARRLATIAWRFTLNWEKAVDLLNTAEKLDSGSFENSAVQSRLFRLKGFTHRPERQHTRESSVPRPTRRSSAPSSCWVSRF